MRIVTRLHLSVSWSNSTTGKMCSWKAAGCFPASQPQSSFIWRPNFTKIRCNLSQGCLCWPKAGQRPCHSVSNVNIKQCSPSEPTKLCQEAVRTEFPHQQTHLQAGIRILQPAPLKTQYLLSYGGQNWWHSIVASPLLIHLYPQKL